MLTVNIFYTNDTKAMFTLVKGFYYLGLSIISLIQFLCENQNVAELALGFTLALAIFESIAAISEGIMKLQKSNTRVRPQGIRNIGVTPIKNSL